MAALCAAVWFPSTARAQVTLLQNNTTRTGIFGGTDSARYYQIDVPPGYSRLSIRTYSDDVGDCDVYVRRSTLPSTSQYDYRSNAAENDESITVTNPAAGSWYIMLYASSTYIGVTLEVGYSGTTDTSVSVGNKIWDFGLDADIYGAPCVARDGTIYVGTSGGGNFYALNPDGTEKWRGNFGNVSASPALAADGDIYVVREPGQLMAISPSGSVRWTFARPTHGKHPVAVAKDGTIYVPSNGNSLLAINANNTLKWEFLVERGFLASSAPVVGADGSVYCGFYHSGRSIGRLYAIYVNGAEKWKYEVGQRVNTPAIDGSGTIVFGVPVNQVYAMNADGTKKWQSQANWGAFYTECYVFSAPAIGADGTIFVSSNRRLVSLNPGNGAEKWHHDTGVLLVGFYDDHISGPAIDSNGIVYYGSSGIFGSGNLYAINSSGALASPAYSIGQVSTQPVITPDGKVIIGSYDARKLVALKASGAAAQSPWPLARQNLANTASLDSLTRPALQITRSNNQVVLSWPTSPAGFSLEFASALPAATWTPVSPAPVVIGGENIVTDTLTSGVRLYRLKKP